MKAVVCGAGIAGLSLAHELATRGDEVVLLERSPGPREQDSRSAGAALAA